jgi:hypothetical protein
MHLVLAIRHLLSSLNEGDISCLLLGGSIGLICFAAFTWLKMTKLLTTPQQLKLEKKAHIWNP